MSFDMLGCGSNRKRQFAFSPYDLLNLLLSSKFWTTHGTGQEE
jgi:hypothetical protein